MRAARIQSFEGPEIIVIEAEPRPLPTANRWGTAGASRRCGSGPVNALIREGKSKVSPQPALTLGTDLSGIVEELGPALLASAVVMRSTVLPALPFCSANAEYAMASAGVIAPQTKTIKPIWIGCNAEQRRSDTAYQPHFQ